MKHADLVAMRSAQRSERLRRLNALMVGTEAPFGFAVRDWVVLTMVFYIRRLARPVRTGHGVSLFVTIPHNHPGTDAPHVVVGFVRSLGWGIAHGPLLVAIQVVLSLFLQVHPIFLARRLPSLVPGSRWPTVAAAVCAFAAALSGADFLTSHWTGTPS
jgi:hypothetical protein